MNLLPSPEQVAATPLGIVVFGPGFGESIVLRAESPDGVAWGVVDSARRDRRGTSVNPARQLLRRCGVRPDMVVLTHPHADHSGGFAALVDDAGPEATVGCVEPLMEELAPFPPERDPDDVRGQRQSQTRLAHLAIQQSWQKGSHRWAMLVGGESRTLGDWTLAVLNPALAELNAAVAARRAGASPNLNDLSAALLLARGDVRIVLAADCAWDAWVNVESRLSPEHLRATRPVKVPHHGSKEAIHPVLIDSSNLTPGRDQVVTPFPRSGRLPRFEPDQGADRLLQSAGDLLLTALPVDLVPTAESTTIGEVRAALTSEDFGGDPDFPVRDERPPSKAALESAERDPRAAWVLLGVHDDGTIDALRGPHAVRLMP